MEYTPDFEREDEIDLKEIDGQIEIWHASAFMDGGTILLNCRYKDKLFQIVSRQWTIISKNTIEEAKDFLHINKNVIKINSNEEKTILKLIKQSSNTAADNLWFLPKFIKTYLWSKGYLWSRRKFAYSIEIFKQEILNFADSKKYEEFIKTHIK